MVMTVKDVKVVPALQRSSSQHDTEHFEPHVFFIVSQMVVLEQLFTTPSESLVVTFMHLLRIALDPQSFSLVLQFPFVSMQT